MSRDWQLYWLDIIECCEKVLRYTQGMDRNTFFADERTYDAVVRNLEIIGEAAKRLPGDVRNLAPEIEWRKISAFRDFVAHAYFGIDADILWNVVSDKIPQLLTALQPVSYTHLTLPTIYSV